MYSCARINGQHQVGPPTTQQVTYDPTTHQQMLRNYTACQYQSVNLRAQPPTRAHTISTDGPQSNRTKRWRQQPAWNNTTHQWQVSYNNVQKPPCNMQNGNYGNYPSHSGLQEVVSPQNSQGWTQSNMIKPNTDNFSFPNEKQSGRMRMAHITQGHPVQQYSNLKSMSSNAGQMPYATASTSLTSQSLAWKDTRGSATGDQTQAGSNQFHGQNSTLNGLYPKSTPPLYLSVLSNHYRTNSVTLKSQPNGHTSHVFTTSPNSQQHSSQQNMAYAEKKEATPSVVSNSNTPQCRPGPVNAQFDAIAKARKESPLLMQLLDNLTGPKIVTRSSTADGVNTCDMETSVTTNYSIPTSPGHTAQKVVCVVQPLSQESCTVPSQNTSFNESNQDTANTATNECLRNEVQSFAPDGTVNNKAPNSSELQNSCGVSVEIQNQSASHESAPSTRDGVSSSDSPTNQYLSQKKPCTDDSGSKPAVDKQIDHHVVPTSEEPESRCGEKDTSELPLDPKSFELSTLPTAQWTVQALTKLIQDDGESVQMKSRIISPVKKLIEMFWNDNTEKFVNKLKSGWYKKLLVDVNKFHRRYMTRDSIILSEAKKEHLRHLHVLENDDVYKAPPFASSWLNINEQLDDIDKEFGFPSSLKHHHHAPENHCKEDHVLTVKKVPVQIEREELSKALSENKPEPEETEETKETEENQTLAVEVTSTQTTSNNTDVEDSMDDHCTFNIQVLPPEEAKRIFEGAQSMSQSRKTDSLQNRDTEFINLTIDSTEDSTLTEIEKFCCISKWKQILLGSDMSPSSNCRCGDRALTPDKDGNVENDNPQFAASPESTLHRGQESPVKDGKDTNKIPTLSWMEEISDDEDGIIFISEDEAVSSNKDDICNPLPDCHEDCEEAQQESTESHHSTSPALNNEHQIAEETLPLSEDCARVASTSPESPQEPTLCQTTPSAGDEEQVQKTKRKQSHDAKLPFRNKLKKRKTQFTTDSASSVSEVRRVKLALFGSSSQQHPALIGFHKRQKTSVQTLRNTSRAPRSLYVNLTPVNTKPPTSPNGDYSVKKLIYERWNLPPMRISHSNKPMRHMRPSNGPSNHKEHSGFNNENMRHGKAKHDKRKNLYKVGRRGVYKLKRSDCDRSNAESESPGVFEKNALKFSVLPETFNFKDGCSGIDDTADDFIDKSKHKTKSQAVTLNKAKASGTWCADSAKKYSPLGQSPIYKSSKIFHEFQKKYRKKMLPPASK